MRKFSGLKLVHGGKPGPDPAYADALGAVDSLGGFLDRLDAESTHPVERAMLIKWRRDLKELRAGIQADADEEARR